jgi:hypothetical protein
MSNKVNSSDRNLIFFFLITYGFSWIFWVPQALMQNGFSLPDSFSRLFSSPFNPAAFGPLIAAAVLTLWNEGKPGFQAFLKKGVYISFQKRWLLLIFLLPPLIYGVSLCIAVMFGWMKFDLANLTNPGMLPFAFSFILFLGGPLQEEFGWRGYALVRLEKRFCVLVASLILGGLWGMWHLPAVFSNTLVVEPHSYWLLVIQITLSSVIFTWIYHNTHQSILAVLLLHTMVNLSIWLAVPSMKLPPGFLACSIFLYLVIDLIIICTECIQKFQQFHLIWN